MRCSPHPLASFLSLSIFTPAVSLGDVTISILARCIGGSEYTWGRGLGVSAFRFSEGETRLV